MKKDKKAAGYAHTTTTILQKTHRYSNTINSHIKAKFIRLAVGLSIIGG